MSEKAPTTKELKEIERQLEESRKRYEEAGGVPAPPASETSAIVAREFAERRRRAAARARSAARPAKSHPKAKPDTPAALWARRRGEAPQAAEPASAAGIARTRYHQTVVGGAR